MNLKNETKKIQILSKLEEASSFWSRNKGLLGRSALAPDEALWIRRCNSIHTIGMKFSIDCVFLDSKMRVKKVVSGIKPFRLIWPVWGAWSVIEMTAGFAQNKFEVGDQLHVGH